MLAAIRILPSRARLGLIFCSSAAGKLFGGVAGVWGVALVLFQVAAMGVGIEGWFYLEGWQGVGELLLFCSRW